MEEKRLGLQSDVSAVVMTWMHCWLIVMISVHTPQPRITLDSCAGTSRGLDQRRACLVMKVNTLRMVVSAMTMMAVGHARLCILADLHVLVDPSAPPLQHPPKV